MSIDGDVIAAHSHWTSDGSQIVTDATIHTDAGDDIVVSQLGGSVDGIGMISMPGPALLAPGMRVAAAAHRGLDLSQNEHVVLDSVRVFSFAPSFVRTGPTKAGHSLYWETNRVPVTPDAAGTTALSSDAQLGAIQAAIAAWTDSTASCADLRMVLQSPKASEVGRDGVNLIKFRDTTWGRPAIGDQAAKPYDSRAAAITTAVFVDDDNSSRDGAIVDADIELNGVNFAITVNQLPASNRCSSELQNTLTHELGHLQGLEHPCLAGTDPARVDDLGNPVPRCNPGSDPPAIADATMYNFQDCGETKKETLSDDDIKAICEIYPPGTDSGGCSTSRRGPAGASLLLAGAVLTMLRRRKLR